MTRFLVLLFYIVTLQSSAQNLVPNASFEELRECPDNFDMLDFVKTWSYATYSTPDCYTSCGRRGHSTPVNLYGECEAKSGESYAGIGMIFSSKLGGLINEAEYIQNRLSTPLVTGKTYCISFYVQLAKYANRAVGNIGMNITKTKTSKKTWEVQNDNPEILHQEIITDRDNWTCINGEYTATGGEQYITIGMFGRSYQNVEWEKIKPTKLRFLQTIANGAYYYIDDVAIVEKLEDRECVCNDNGVFYAPVEEMDTTSLVNDTINIDTSHVNEVFVYPDIKFDHDKATLRPEAEDKLDEILSILEKYPNWIVEISGHTDNVGGQDYNADLSQRRAETVVEWLIDKGIDKSRLVPKGYGAAFPIDTNETEEGRLNNRRVEMKVLEE